jgi:hypothetical protein
VIGAPLMVRIMGIPPLEGKRAAHALSRIDR